MSKTCSLAVGTRGPVLSARILLAPGGGIHVPTICHISPLRIRPCSSFNLLLCHCPRLAHAAQVKCNIGLASADMTDHDDFIKWKHFPRHWPFVRGIHWPSVNSPHKGQWRGALMFSLIWPWKNGWVNNREAYDLRRHRAHYDSIVMEEGIIHWWQLLWYRSCRRTHFAIKVCSFAEGLFFLKSTTTVQIWWFQTICCLLNLKINEKFDFKTSP